MGNEDIAVRLSVPELVATYRQAEVEVRAAFAALNAAVGRLDGTIALKGCGMRLTGYQGQFYLLDDCDVEHALVGLRRQVWSSLVERMELRRLMWVLAARAAGGGVASSPWQTRSRTGSGWTTCRSPRRGRRCATRRSTRSPASSPASSATARWHRR